MSRDIVDQECEGEILRGIVIFEPFKASEPFEHWLTENEICVANVRRGLSKFPWKRKNQKIQGTCGSVGPSKHNCPTILQVPGKLRRKILVVAVGTTRTLLFPPRHLQESVPPKDVVLEDCLTGQAMFTYMGSISL